MQGPHWIIVVKCCHYNGAVFHFIYLSMTYIPLLKEAPSPEGMCLFNQLQHFFRVQQEWMEWPCVSSDNTAHRSSTRVVKKPPGWNNGRQHLQPDLMGTLCSRDHLDWWTPKPPHAPSEPGQLLYLFGQGLVSWRNCSQDQIWGGRQIQEVALE